MKLQNWEKPEEDKLHEDTIDQSEEMRLYMAKKYGLDENASWDMIINTEDEDIRKKSATVLGLDENASWEQIHAAENGQGDRVSSALLLGLNRDAKYDEIVAERTRRNLELHNMIAEQIARNQSLKNNAK